MEADSWSCLSQRHLQSRLDEYVGLEEGDDGAEDESRMEYACPFCPQDFDVIGLCCHIEDEHPAEAKSGVCPLCAAKVEFNLVGHLTMQHASFFKMERRKRLQRGSAGSHTILSLLKKDLLDGDIQSLSDGTPFEPTPDTTPDPLLCSFILNVPGIQASDDERPRSLNEGSVVHKQSDEKATESAEPIMSDKEHEERVLKSEFVRGVVLSTVFEEESV